MQQNINIDSTNYTPALNNAFFASSLARCAFAIEDRTVALALTVLPAPVPVAPPTARALPVPPAPAAFAAFITAIALRFAPFRVVGGARPRSARLLPPPARAPGTDVVRVMRSRSIFLRNGLGRFSSSERSYCTGGGSGATRVGTGAGTVAVREVVLDGGRGRDFERAREEADPEPDAPADELEGRCIALRRRGCDAEERMDGRRRRVLTCRGVLSTSSSSTSVSLSKTSTTCCR